jgi:hypothetical protein
MAHAWICPFCFGDERLPLLHLVAHLLGFHQCQQSELIEILSQVTR